MNDATAQSAFHLGHLTEQERNQLLLDAEERQRRLHEERLKAAEEKGVLDTARLVLAGKLSPDELEAEMSKLGKWKTADAMQRALFKLLAR